MPTIQSSLLNKTVYQGAAGNVSKVGFSITLAAAAIGTIVQGRTLPGGIKITGVEYINAALGTGVTVDIKAGDATLVSALSCAAAGKGYIPIDDVSIPTDFNLLSLVIGGGAATGKVTARLFYEVIGNL